MKNFLIILLFLHLLYFFPFYFTEKIFFQRDLPFLTIPYKYQAISLWKRGVLPFLDDKLSNGQPLLANPTSSSLYPLMFPLLFFPFLKTFTYLMLFHHLFFLFGLFIFSYKILKNPYICLFLAIFAGFNGIVLEFFSFCNPLWGIAYLPWCLFFFYKFLTENKIIYLILTSIFFSLSILAGFDLAPILFSFFLFLLTCFYNFKKFFYLLLCFFLTFLLSSIQIIPTLLYLPHSSRALSLPYEDDIGFFSLHPLRTIEIILPHFHGLGANSPVNYFWADGISDRKFGLFRKLYLGIFSLILILSIRPFKKKWIFFILTLIFLLLSFGRYFPLHHFLAKLPLISNLRFPEKFLIFLFFFYYFFSIEILKNHKKFSPIPSGILSFFIFVLILLNKLSFGNLFKNYISSITFEEITIQPKLMEKFLLISLIFSLFTLVFLFFLNKFNKLNFLIPIFCLFDLYYGTFSLIEAHSQNITNTPLIRILKENQSQRILHIEQELQLPFLDKNLHKLRKETLKPYFGVLFGFSYGFATSVDAMEVPYLKELEPSKIKLWGISDIIYIGERPPKNAKDLYKFENFVLWNFDKSPTFLWFLNDEKKTAQPLFPSVDLKNPSKIFLNIENKERGILWVGRFLLPGWRVYLNGKKEKMHNLKEEGLNIYLKPGKNEVKFIYKPPGFFIGLSIFILGIFLCVIIFLWKRKN